LGRIGKAIAARCVAMGMKIAYTGRKAQHVPYEFVPDLKSLAAAVDFLVVACPGGEATRNIVNAATGGRLTSGVYVDPASKEVEKDYVLDPKDPIVTVSVPPGFTETRANRSWLIFHRCA